MVSSGTSYVAGWSWPEFAVREEVTRSTPHSHSASLTGCWSWLDAPGWRGAYRKEQHVTQGTDKTSDGKKGRSTGEPGAATTVGAAHTGMGGGQLGRPRSAELGR